MVVLLPHVKQALRLMTAPNIAVAKKAALLGNFLYAFCAFLAQLTGLVMYATFHGCDPVKSGLIKNVNQLVPAYLIKVLSSYIMLPGFLFTGIMCAALSTLSSVYNSTATILYNMLPVMSGQRATLVCKFLVFLVGILSTLGVAITELFPNVQQSVMSIYNALSAPLFAMFLIGFFCPQANIKATFMSFICSLCLLLYIIAGTLVVQPKMVTKPLLVDQCDPPFNTSARSLSKSSITSLHDSLDAVEMLNASLISSFGTTSLKSPSLNSWSAYFPLSSMSYLWIGPVGTLSTLFIFVLLSIFLGKETSKNVDLELIPEIVQKIHRSLPHDIRSFLLCNVYHDLEDEQKKLKIETITTL